MKLRINTRTRVDHLSTGATSILQAMSAYDYSADIFFTGLVQKLTHINNLMTEAINEKKAVSQLSEKDDIRDDALRTIFYEVKSKSYWPDATIRNAADIVQDVLDNYGMEILNVAFNAQSANVNALLVDFEKPNVAAAIDVLTGLKDLIEVLKNSQKGFEESYQHLISNRVDQKQLLSASKLGVQIVELINNEMVVYLQAMSLAKPEMYSAGFNKLETIIKDMNSKTKSRSKQITTNQEASIN